MKKLKKEKIKINKSQLIEIGSFLIILLCAGAMFYQIYSNNKRNFQLIWSDKFFQSDLNRKVTSQEYFEEEIQNNEVIEETEQVVEEQPVHVNYENYIGVLEIKKINLKRGFYSKTSRNNNVNRNIQVLNESDMPNIENGNVIIAGHSGSSYVSFFRNLNKLDLYDEAIIYFEGKQYNYQLKNKYEIDKTGQAVIKRNKEKNVLTLITCKHNTNKQIVFIFELNEIK